MLRGLRTIPDGAGMLRLCRCRVLGRFLLSYGRVALLFQIRQFVKYCPRLPPLEVMAWIRALKAGYLLGWPLRSADLLEHRPEIAQRIG